MSGMGRSVEAGEGGSPALGRNSARFPGHHRADDRPYLCTTSVDLGEKGRLFFLYFILRSGRTSALVAAARREYFLGRDSQEEHQETEVHIRGTTIVRCSIRFHIIAPSASYYLLNIRESAHAAGWTLGTNSELET